MTPQQQAAPGEPHVAPPIRRRFRPVASGASALASLAVAELVLWLFCPLTYETRSASGELLDWQAFKPYGCRADTTVWELDFAQKTTQQGIADWDAGVPSPDQSGIPFTRHPVRGWECDSGFRTRGRAPTTWRSTTTLHVLAVGDSFTFGSDVQPHEAWCHVLQSTTPGAEVLNGGVPGYGVDQVALKLEEYGPQLKPDVVLWGLVNDDVLRAGRSWFPKSWMPKPRLVVQGDGWSVVPPRTRKEVYESASGWHPRLGLVARAGLDALRYGSWSTECIELFRDILRISRGRVASWGGRLIVVHMPTGGALLREDDAMGAQLQEICRELEVEVVDVRAALRALNLNEDEVAGFTLRPGGRGHYTPLGNRLVAKVVCAYLARGHGGNR